MKERTYFAIDLKSFYASVECVLRKLDPLKTNLVVADKSRTEKTICLAVSPSLKQYGIPSRARLFEVIHSVKEINKERFKKNGYKKFRGKSYDDDELKDKSLELDYIVATPQMAKYMEMSGKIYSIYLKYFGEDDIHVYSIDEVFIDVTKYLSLYKLPPEGLASKVVNEIFKATGITATAGIGTNLFLAKVAMDTIAKKAKPDKNGVRIGFLDETKFRTLLWNHKPLTDFWRIGPGITRRLEANGMHTLYDVAKRSLEDEDSLFQIFGINAELIINHAWGVEPTLISDIKKYQPINKSLSQGQVLSRPYTYSETITVIKEMADLLAMDLSKKKLVTDQVVCWVGYEKLVNQKIKPVDIEKSYVGQLVPSPTGGSCNLKHFTSSSSLIQNACVSIFKENSDPNLLVRRIGVVATHIFDKDSVKEDNYEQLDLFGDYEKEAEFVNKLRKEEKIQDTLNKIKSKYGKNAVLKGTSYLKEGTTKVRNTQIGGHKA
ncbi:MAG: DNA methylase [Bacilli bacterium]|nr:DNA methylase [Bacilli bacterium]